MAEPSTVDYTGHFERALDDKGRLTLPSDWRRAHDETVTFMAYVSEGHITVLPPDEAQKVRNRIKEIKLSDKVAQAAATKFSSEAQSFSFDKAGRVILNAQLLERAGIEQKVVFAGSMTKFKIFSPARWTEMEALAASAEGKNTLEALGV
jgi:MraZ protein